MFWNFSLPLFLFFADFNKTTQDLEKHAYWNKFIDFSLLYNKTYDNSDIKYRFDIFIENIEKIDNNPSLGINKYADLNSNEFKNIFGGCTLHRKIPFTTCSPFSEDKIIKKGNVPESIDWREFGAVTNVKNQGNCGSCWAFSATGAIEGAVKISTGNLYNFSEQQLVDCVERMGGCNGGLMDDAFIYFEENELCEFDEIPYEAKDDQCPQGPCKDKSISLSGCVDVPPGNETALKLAVSQGPVSVAIEADKEIFQLYTGGIIKSEACGSNLDHGVLIVGYGEENGDLYWIVKNSWGPEWGENGYVKIGRSYSDELSDGICGIALQASYPLV